MFDIGFWELVILFCIGLLVLGPERLPRVAAQVGGWAGRARSMARNLTRQFRDELEPLEKMQSNLKSTMDKPMTTDWAAKRPEPGQTAASSESSAATSTETSAATDSPADASVNAPDKDA